MPEEANENDSQIPAMEAETVGVLEYTCSFCKLSFKSYHAMRTHSKEHVDKSRRRAKIQFTGEETLQDLLDKLYVTKEGLKACSIC